MKNGLIRSLCPLLVLALFAMAVLSVLSVFATGYSELGDSADGAYASATALRFVKTKLQSADSPLSVSVEPFGDSDSIVIRESYGELEYLTRLYCHGGMLCELFVPAAYEFSPEDGEPVVPLEAMRAELSEGFFRFVLSFGEESFTLLHPSEVK